MARLLALDWTRHEARYILATESSGALTVNSAGSLDLSALSDEEFHNAEKLGETLQAGLASVKPGRAVTLIGIDRPSVELLEFSVPPVPESELPGMVLNLAMRESSSISEESVLDFVSVPIETSEQQKLTAVAITAEELKRIGATCEAAKLLPRRMLLRAYATAAIFSADTNEELHRRLLVNRVGDDADLTVIDAGHVVFTRTVRIPNRDDEVAITSRLLQEIRRTMMVAPHSRSGGEIQSITILGREDENGHFLQAAREEFTSAAAGDLEGAETPVDVRCFDVFAAVEMADEIVLENSGRFAPLLGMLQTEAGGGEHPFDFLNPRKPPKPRDLKRPLAVGGGLLAMVLLFFGYSTWSNIADAKADNDILAAKLKEMKKGAKERKEQKTIAGAIATWESHGVNWLTELDSFSQKFPSARDAMVLRMSLTPSRDSGGTISFSGLSRDPTVVTKMELNLRDDQHEVQTPRVKERVQEDGYAWHFDTKIVITKPKPKPKPKSKSKKQAAGAKKANSKKQGDQSDTEDKSPAGKEDKSRAAQSKKSPPKEAANKSTKQNKTEDLPSSTKTRKDGEKPQPTKNTQTKKQAGEAK